MSENQERHPARQPFSTMGLFIATALLIATVSLSLMMGRQGAALKLPGIAPQGVLSMELPDSREAALKIVRAWNDTIDTERSQAAGHPVSLAGRFHDQLVSDRYLIALYTATLALFLGWGCRACRCAWWVTLGLLLLPLLAAGFDWVENQLMQVQVDGVDLPNIAATTRLMAQLKFTSLLVASVSSIVLVGGGLRTRRSCATSAAPTTGTFADLVMKEGEGIRALRTTGGKQELAVEVEATEEPRVSFRSSDYVGLALSGGGIRSATFNLGLLQTLSECGVLGLVDYISTVSGGGYVGGFLSAWLSAATPGQVFPTVPRSKEAGRVPPEPGEVRHLREFSGFLAPRRGFFEAEMWRAVVAILSGLLPSLTIALSLIGLVLVGFLTITFVYACDWRIASAAAVAAITATVLVLFERMAPQYAPATSSSSAIAAADATPPVPAVPSTGSSLYWWVSGVAVALVLAAQMAVPSLYKFDTDEGRRAMPLWTSPTPPATPVALKGLWKDAPGANAYERWWFLVGARDVRDAPAASPTQTTLGPYLSPRLFDFALTWMVAAGILLLVRLAHAVRDTAWSRRTISTFDRVVMRLLGLGLVWFGLAAVWHICVNVKYGGQLAVSAVVSGAIFASMRNWLVSLTGRTSGPSTWRTWIAPYIPMVLAYVTMLLVIALVGRALLDINDHTWLKWYGSTFAMLSVIAFGLLIEPSRVGLHAFYRDRIGRAYLGARATANAAENRTTDSEDQDDVRVADLKMRPHHLVCCAANDIAGDPVATLQRGARSATISRLGLALGNAYVEPGNLTLGSAVTASAAAFNSNMGAQSIQFGPIVDFLLTALNLRLGLWMRHPCAATARPRRWPGLLFYREFFSQTSASRASTALAHGNTNLPTLERDVHLSDGGHFENLALYELVRRQCRYIIVSDCGADPTVAFDDLGNALRRIREDFDVEVEIDVTPLKPKDGISTQHVAVGSINYSRVNRGVLIYIKPALTGSEPPDVRQYRTRNNAFPHESTGDQFYDEAQWESYRRLGAHTGQRVFSFIKEFGHPEPLTADWLFANAVSAWYPTPPDLRDSVLAMTERFGQLENELRHEKECSLLREVFPELDGSGGAANWRRPLPTLTPALPPSQVSATDLAFMLRATQLLEDVWMACRLDQLWAHPLNMGWVNLFARWTTAPTFRFWWPVLAPMYSAGFQSFLRHRIGVGITGPMRPKGVPGDTEWPDPSIALLDGPPNGLAGRWWLERSNQRRRWAQNPDAFTFYALTLPVRADTLATRGIELGVTAVTRKDALAGWTSEDFFVPPSLWGAGYGGRMLRLLLEQLKASGCARCYVCVKAPLPGNDNNITREDERAFVAQYRGQRFQQIHLDATVERVSDDDMRRRREIESLSLGVEPGDTILMLDPM